MTTTSNKSPATTSAKAKQGTPTSVPIPNNQPRDEAIKPASLSAPVRDFADLLAQIAADYYTSNKK